MLGSVAMTASLTIDVFSDLVCPWCFIGSVRLEQAIASLGDEVDAEVCFHPFFLDPKTPRAGTNVPDMLRRKYGVDPKQIWARAETAARESGIELDLSKQPLMFPTLKAHTLLRHALAKGTQRSLSAGLFRGYFLDAQDIADEQVLAEHGAQHGFTREEAFELVSSAVELELTREEAMAAAQGGIRGVPFFIFGGKLAVSGAQSASVLSGAMRQALLHVAGAEPAAEK
jgi:predicted DsbA family dithiol-disulfide isomerase